MLLARGWYGTGMTACACGCWWAAGVMEKFGGKRPNFPVYWKNLHARAGGPVLGNEPPAEVMGRWQVLSWAVFLLPIPAPPLVIRQSHREG